jgi:hypothetical protein
MLAIRSAALAVTVAIALSLAACGGDDEGETTEGGGAATERIESVATGTAPAKTGTTTDTETAPADGDEAEGGGAEAPGGDSPEDQPGGAGDEVPASSQALITGRGGKLHPTVVRVPPFIAIRVQLRSADGIEYRLSGDGGRVAAGGEVESASTTFEGLRTGERLVLTGPQGKVTIEANAEPGP